VVSSVLILLSLQLLQTLQDLDAFFQLPTIGVGDVRFMIEARRVSSRGIRFIDAQLIGACLATPGTRIWTVDGPLGRAARRSEFEQTSHSSFMVPRSERWLKIRTPVTETKRCREPVS
jgi:hypothetical protein